MRLQEWIETRELQHTRSLGLQSTGRPSASRSLGPGSRLFEVAPGIFCLQQPLVNLYFVRTTEGDSTDGCSWVLVDAGLPYTAAQVDRAADMLCGPHVRPKVILLTHGHFDHVGALPQLAELWDVPVYAHPAELPYLTGRSSYPPPDPSVGGGLMAFLSKLYPRGPIDLGDRVLTLPDDGSVPELSGWTWIHTPGHTGGHVSYFREADRTLLAGDAFVTTKQESALHALLPRRPHVHRPPAYYTSDWTAARQSVEILAGFAPRLALTGHGLPLAGRKFAEELRTLARDWEHEAVPRRGRYVRQPAVTGLQGVVSVPPPVADPRAIALAGIGVALGLLLLVRTYRRSN